MIENEVVEHAVYFFAIAFWSMFELLGAETP
jgi:hypothetical protein